MADRRMFAKSVIGSGRFLRMPPSSRLLYYDLGMEADDDGCVEAFSVMQKTGAREDDLRVLASKGFIKVLNDDLVAYITDWAANNKIRKDRYHEGRYLDLIGAELPSPIPIVLCQPDDNQVSTTCQPSDNQMATEVRLGKDRLGKDRLESGKPASRFTPPTVVEVKDYCSTQGYHIDPDGFVDYYASNGWMVGRGKMKDWKAAVRNWARRDKEKAQKEQPKKRDYGGDNFWDAYDEEAGNDG